MLKSLIAIVAASALLVPLTCSAAAAEVPYNDLALREACVNAVMRHAAPAHVQVQTALLADVQETSFLCLISGDEFTRKRGAVTRTRASYQVVGILERCIIVELVVARSELKSQTTPAPAMKGATAKDLPCL